jgi:hypothetical protein
MDLIRDGKNVVTKLDETANAVMKEPATKKATKLKENGFSLS